MSGGEIPAGRVFISYSRTDAQAADELQAMLEAARVRVWRDTNELLPGQDWPGEIRRAISRDSVVFLACFSSRSVSRATSYQYAELALAVEQFVLRRPDVRWLIPVRFDECEIPDLEIGGGRTLSSIQRIDLFGDQHAEQAERLIEAVRQIFAAAAGAARRPQSPGLGHARALDLARFRALSGYEVAEEVARTSDQDAVGLPLRGQARAPSPGRSMIRTAAEIQASPVRLNRKVTLWGPPASGKTTFLAALNTALAQASPPWSLTGADPACTELLIEMTAGLLARRQFPAATVGIDILRFVMAGELETRGIIRRGKRAPIQFDLSVVDTSGWMYRTDSHRQRAELVAQLAQSDGIIFFFDPVREADYGEAYESFHAAAAWLKDEIGTAGGSRLPHHIAVCIAKFDEPSVFSAAAEAGYLVVDANDPYGFPRVADDRAADFFDELCRKFHQPGARLLRHTIETYFREDRIRYFAISSAGFYLNESMRFDPDDYYNLIAEREGWSITLRGGIYPVNVLEPLLWLAAPARHGAAVRRRHRDCMRLDPRSEQTRPVRQSQAAPAAAPCMADNSARPAHLVCLVEISGADDAARCRLDLLGELVDVIAEVTPELPVSLISYGSHSISPSVREEPVNVLAWASDSSAVLRLISDLAHSTAAAPEYRLAAQLECALAEVARRLSGTQECAALVTVGSRPAFPPRMRTDSRTLPCPSRNDWQAILGKLRTDLAVVLGAIEDHGSDGGQIWAELGIHARAHTDAIYIPRFAASLGLGPQPAGDG